MKVINESLLDEFRIRQSCEWCGRPTPGGCDPAHVRTRGAGRVDVRENVCGLCRWCHTSSGDGNDPTTAQLLALVARREGKSVAAIRAKIDRIRADQSVKVWRVK